MVAQKLPATTSQIPHVYIYVHEQRTVEGGRNELRRLGFVQLPISKGGFPFNDAPPIWMPIQPDKLSEAYQSNQVLNASATGHSPTL